MTYMWQVLKMELTVPSVVPWEERNKSPKMPTVCWKMLGKKRVNVQCICKTFVVASTESVLGYMQETKETS